MILSFFFVGINCQTKRVRDTQSQRDYAINKRFDKQEPRTTLVIVRVIWARLVCSVLVNSDSLTANYGIKQSQFTKPISEPRASDPEESNKVFDRAIALATLKNLIRFLTA